MPRKEANKSKARRRSSAASRKPAKSRKAESRRVSAPELPSLFDASALSAKPESKLREQEAAAVLETPASAPTAVFGEDFVTLPASAFDTTVPVPVAPPSRIEKLISLISLFDSRTACASVAVGLAMGWQFCGARTIFSAEIDPLPATTTMVGAIALMLVAAGMAIPERTMAWISSVAQSLASRGKGRGGHEPTTHGHQQSDLCLSWLALGLVSAATAVAGILGVVLSWPLFGFYQRLLHAFFWTDVSLAGMEWAFSAVLLIVPCLAVGVLIVNLAVLAAAGRKQEHWSASAQVGLLLGFACALALDALPGWRLSAEREVVFGTLPLFALAAGAVHISHREERRSRPVQDGDIAAPEFSGGPDLFVRIVPLLWACAAAVACVGSLGCRPALADERMSLASLLGGTALGYVISLLAFRRFGPWLYSQGALFCSSGIGAGLAATFAACSPGSGSLRALGMLALSLACGHTLQGLSRAWLARAASRSLGLTHLAMVLLAGAAIGVAVARWWALPQLGPMGTLTIGSLVLMAIGGLLELHGEDQPSRSQRIRLGVIFASLAAAIIMFPTYTRWWTRQDIRQIVSTSEVGLGRQALADLIAGVRTACLIGVDPATVEQLPEGRTTQVEVLPLATWRIKPQQRQAKERVQAVAIPAPRALRLTRTRYQLLYQFLRPDRDSASLYCSAEWLVQLHEHVADGGMLVVDLPLSGLDPTSVVELAGTFQHVSMSPSFWAVTGGSQPRLLLSTQPAAAQLSSVEGLKWSPIDQLIGQQNAGRIQTIRSGRVALAREAQVSTQQVLEWLGAQAGRFSPVARVATPRPIRR